MGAVREDLGRDSHVHNILYDTGHQGAPAAKHGEFYPVPKNLGGKEGE